MNIAERRYFKEEKKAPWEMYKNESTIPGKVTMPSPYF